MAHNDLERAKNEVALDVKKLYYQLLSAQQRKHAAELRRQASEARLKEAQDAAQSGVALQVKLLEGRAQIAEAKHSVGSIQDQIADLTNSFNDLVGLPLPTETELIEPAEASDPTINVGVAATPEDLAIAVNPELRSARQAVAKAHAGLNAARAEYIPDVSLIVQHTYQTGAPLLPENTAAVGVHAEWTISEFGKRIGLVRERKSQVAQAQENLLATERKTRMEVQSETRKIHRSETGLEAARESVAVRTELVRITNDQVVAKTANESALEDAQAELASAKAQLFDAEMERAIAQAELVRTEGCQ
jgi:outer membrane protein TolC